MIQDHTASVGVAAAKAAPPTMVTAATILGYPVEHIIVWLTLIWWVWLIGEKAVARVRALRRRRRA